MAAVVRLVSKEAEIVEVELDVIMVAEVVKTAVAEKGIGEDIHLGDVTVETLHKVIEFLKYHSENPLPKIERPLKSNNMYAVVPEWYAKFIDIDIDEIFQLTTAADSMGIKPLLEFSGCAVACKMKGRSIVEIRALFNIENDFTPEEEEQIREENKWAEDAI